MNKKEFIIAGPSCVYPGGIWENALLLKDKVSEIGLTFFQSQACLEYTDKELPRDLAGLNLKYHVHLPLDYDWDMGVRHNFDITRRLIEKVRFLSPDKFVLHPPDRARLLEDFAHLWIKEGLPIETLLVENIRTCDFSGLWEIIEDSGVGICLDIGHIMAYDQHSILTHGFIWNRISLIHVYGREDHTGHVKLPLISDEGKATLHLIMNRIQDKTSVLVEVFAPEDFLDSKKFLIEMAEPWGMDFV
ncbi:MAG: cobamide remodeling phosphodiesterase CbiR, partial [Desulfonatronovibrio sp.]